MRAVLVKNDEDDYTLINVEVPDDARYVTYKGEVFDFCGVKDGVAFFTDLRQVPGRLA